MIHWLIGPSGAGKSTVGRELAAQRSAWFIDLDQKIEEMAGTSIAGIFAAEGEAGFRTLERTALRRIVADHKRKRLVVAVGGGGVIDPRNRDLMRSTGLRILLEVDAGTALERLSGNHGRPLLITASDGDLLTSWNHLLKERAEAYADHDIAVDAVGSPTQVVKRIINALYKFHNSQWRINAHLAGETSKVFALRSPYSTIRAVRRMTRFSRRCVITDRNIHALYEETLRRLAGNDGIVIPVEPGEEGKSFATVERLIGQLVEADFSRADCIIGFGGGMVTDLAGFVSSIYMRGLRCISVPTSLLGMVDASVGGKTAINAAGIRNLVGTFRQPTDVLICDAFLRTLPGRELRSGMVEALKMGMIAWGDLYRQVLRATPDILAGRIPARVSEIVRESILAKLEIVGKDVRDEKERQMLNLGHTFGHALEAACPGVFTHGEAVAFGIVAASELSGAIFINIDREDLAAIGDEALPYTFVPETPPDFEQVLAKMSGDKKSQGGMWRFVLPTARDSDRKTKKTTYFPEKTRALIVGVGAERPAVLAAMERAWERIISYHRGNHHRRTSE